jgi:hypothetical protein
MQILISPLQDCIEADIGHPERRDVIEAVGAIAVIAEFDDEIVIVKPIKFEVNFPLLAMAAGGGGLRRASRNSSSKGIERITAAARAKLRLTT